VPANGGYWANDFYDDYTIYCGVPKLRGIDSTIHALAGCRRCPGMVDFQAAVQTLMTDSSVGEKLR
jgi:formylmethanofuran dehydrogenase subunit D